MFALPVYVAAIQRDRWDLRGPGWNGACSGRELGASRVGTGAAASGAAPIV